MHKRIENNNPAIPFTTISGRRVVIKPTLGAHTRRLIAAVEGVEERKGKRMKKTEDWEFTKWLIDDLVDEVGPDGELSPIDYNTMTLGEETDILLLIRLRSLGQKFIFAYKCPKCGTKQEAEVDCRMFKRYLLLPSEDAPPNLKMAYDLARYNPFEDIGPEELAVNWEDLPHDYIEKVKEHPRKMDIVLPNSQTRVHFRLPLARDKKRIGEWMMTNDNDIIAQSLATMVWKMEFPGGKGIEDHGATQDYTPAKAKDLFAAELADLTLRDVLELRDAVAEEDIGIDTEIEVYCNPAQDGCGAKFETPCRFDSNFFLPTTLTSKASSGRSSRYRAR